MAEFLLTSWLYAFFCFDYKWSLRRQPLAARIAYFEAHWAFFGGFGAACTLPVSSSLSVAVRDIVQCSPHGMCSGTIGLGL